MKTNSMKKITVLHVIERMNRGGVETVAMNILRHIDNNRFSFVFLCAEGKKYDYEDELIALGAKIIRAPGPRDAGLMTYLKNFKRIVNSENIDIVHAHNHSMYPLIAATYSGVKSRIYHSHTTGVESSGGLGKQFHIYLSKLIINILSTDRVACGIEAGKYMFGDRPFMTFHNGIILEDFYFSIDNRRMIRRDYNISDSAIVIGHIGRMVPVKNQKFVIEIFKEYLKLKTNSYLLLVGNGEQKVENEEYAKKHMVEGKVKFLGSRGDVNALYSAMDLFILPSMSEGLPVTLIEAQANGLESLASDTVSETANITGGVEFYSLKKGAIEWANKINSMDLARFDARKTLKQTPYNMKIGVKDMEKLYLETTGNN